MAVRVVVGGVDLGPRCAWPEGCAAVADDSGYCGRHRPHAVCYCGAEEPRPHPAHTRRFRAVERRVRP